MTKRNVGSLVGKKRLRKPEETESDSDYDDINLIAQKHQTSKKNPTVKSETGERQPANKKRKTYLEEYLTFGELSGLIPQSLLVNVNFERFADANGFEPLEQASTLKSDKK